jgi:excisionase family DNA binding protein
LSELLAALSTATPERKAAALKVLNGEAFAAGPLDPEPMKAPLLLTVGSAAKYLGVSRTTLWRMACEGRIGRVEVRRGSYRIRRQDVEEFASRGRRTGCGARREQERDG